MCMYPLLDGWQASGDLCQDLAQEGIRLHFLAKIPGIPKSVKEEVCSKRSSTGWINCGEENLFKKLRNLFYRKSHILVSHDFRCFLFCKLNFSFVRCRVISCKSRMNQVRKPSVSF